MGPIQIFGTKKCSDSRKAERFWKERGVKVHFVDLKEKNLSPGELRSVAQRVGGLDQLVDKESPRYRERGLHVSSYAGKLLEPILLEEPMLLRTPITRNGAQATVGYEPDKWLAWIAAG